MEKLIKAIIEWGGNEIQKWVERGGDDGCYLFLAPYLAVLLFGYLQYLEKLVIAQILDSKNEIVESCLSLLIVLLVIVFANKFSSIIMRAILKVGIFAKIFEKFSAYERIQDSYYLKETQKEVRHLFQSFDKPLLVGVAVVCFMLQCAYIEKYENWLMVGEMLGLWAFIKAKYLTTRTYEEDQNWYRKVDKPAGWTNRDSNVLKNQLLNKAMSFYANFLVGTSEVYPEKPDLCKKYRDIYENLSVDRSILITDAFYQDWERAFFIPVHRFLLYERKVIILSGANMDTENLKQWVQKELEHMLGIKKNWRIKIWTQGSNNWDIVVVPYEQIPFFAKEMKSSKSFRGAFTLVLEPSRMIMEMRTYLELLAESFRCMKEEPVYCFADVDFYNLADTLSHIFKVKIQSIAIDWDKGMSVYSYGIDETVQSDVFNYWGVKDYWGNDSVIISELSKHGEIFTHCSQGMVPVRDIKNALKGKILSSVRNADELKIMEESLERCEFKGSFWETKRRQDLNIIVYDEWCNFFQVTNFLSSRAMGQSHIFVLSEKYILRDFLWDMAKKYLFAKNFIPVFVPIYQENKRNKVINTLISAYQEPISAETLAREFPLEGGGSLLNSMNVYLKSYVNSGSHGTVFYEKSKNEWILDKAFMSKNEWWLEDVYFIDETKNTEPFGCRKLGHIYQKYLPGQFITLHGCYYRFINVEKRDEHFVMQLVRSSSLVRQPFSYHQNRKYFMGNVSHEKMILKDEKFELKWCTSNIIVSTKGYDEMEKWNWSGDRGSVIKKFIQVQIPYRKYKKKRWIHLMIRGENDDDLYENLAILLNEIAKTILPLHCQYLAIMPFHKSQNSKEILYDLTAIGSGTGLCIIEDCMEDMGILEVFETHFAKIMDVCGQYCRWAVDNDDKYFEYNGWKEDLKKLCAFFDFKAGMQGSQQAAKQTSATIVQESPFPNTKTCKMPNEADKACVCCGTEVLRVRGNHLYRYCRRCLESVNSIEVYYNSFLEAANWMMTSMGISCTIKPQIKRRWSCGQYAWLRPIEAEYSLFQYGITCKKHMDRRYINSHMVYAYVGLWYYDNRVKCNVYMEKYNSKYRKTLLQTWFFIQHLYLNLPMEEAQYFEEQEMKKKAGKDLKDFFDEHPIEKNKVLSDEALNRLTEENPIAHILKSGRI